jgi:hemolysin III
MLRKISPQERANSLTHALGLVLSLFGVGLLAGQSLWHNSVPYTLSVSVYGVSLVSVYTSSTLHHVATSERLKRAFMVLDHSCIYLLIAGTYTPFMVTVLRGAQGLAMLGAVWTLGVAGIVWKSLFRVRTRLGEGTSIAFYVAMGWLIVLLIKPFASTIHVNGLLLLLAGGLCYSLGLIFFLWTRLTYGHAIWHLCVLAGSALHFLSVLLYAIPT